MSPGRFFVFLSSLILFSALGPTGCSSGNNAPELPTDARGNQIQIASDRFVLQPNVKELADDGSLVVGQITNTSVILSGRVPALAVGDIVIKNAGDQQFLRKVLAVTAGPGQVTLQTGPAVMTDVFSSANITETINLGPDFLEQLTPALPGVTFGIPEQVRARGEEVGSPWVLPVHFGEAVLSSDSGRGSVVGDGDITIRFALYKDLQVGVKNFLVPTVNHFALVPKITVSGRLKLTGKGSGDFAQEFDLTGPLTYDLAGFGPVSLSVNVKLKVGVDGYVQADGELAMDGSVELEGGIEATNDQWGLFAPPVVSQFTVSPPKFQANAAFNVNLLSPRISLGVLGMGSAWVDANMLRLETEARVRQSDFEVVTYKTTSLDCGAHLSLGISPLAVKYDGSFTLLKAPRQEVARIGVPLPRTDVSTFFVLSFPPELSLRQGEAQLLIALTFIRIQVGPALVPVPIFQPCNFTSRNGNVARARGFGFFAIVEALNPGQAEIQVVAPDGVEGRALAKVKNDGLSSIAFQTSVLTGKSLNRLGSTTIAERSNVSFRAIGTYADGQTVDLTYASTLTAAGDAEVARNGNVHGRGEGRFLLQARNTLAGKSGQVEIQVERPRVEQLFILPSFPETGEIAGGQLQLQALGWFQDGSRRYLTDDVSWLTGDPATATIQRGLLSTVALGEVIVAAYDPQSDLYAFKRVRIGGKMTKLELAPTTPTRYRQGHVQEFRATATFEKGGTRDVTSLAQFTATNDNLGRFTGPGLFQFSGLGSGRLKAFYNRETARTPNLDVQAPAGFRFRAQPVGVNLGQAFDLTVEVLDEKEQLFEGAQQVNLELLGGPGNANLAGSLSETSSNGVATFHSLSVDQVGADFRIRVFANGLTVKDSDVFAVVSPLPTVSEHIVLNNRSSSGNDAFSVETLDSTGALVQEETLFAAGRPESIVRVGNYLYVANSSPGGPGPVRNSISEYRYNPITGVPTFLRTTPGNFWTAYGSHQPISMETNGSDTLFILGADELVLYALQVNAVDGNLTPTDSLDFGLSTRVSQPNGLTFHDVPGSTSDLLFVTDQALNKVHVLQFDSIQRAMTAVPGSPFANSVPAPVGSPIATVVVGNYLYAANPLCNAVSRWSIDFATGNLTTLPDRFSTGPNSQPIALHAVDRFVYTGNFQDSSLSAFQAQPDGTLLKLNGGANYPAGNINPHAFVDVLLGTVRALYVATSTRVGGFTLAADGALTPVAGSPFNYSGSPGVLRH